MEIEKIEREIQESRLEMCLRKAILESEIASNELKLAFPFVQDCKYNCLGTGRGYDCLHYVPVSYLKTLDWLDL
jgi:hypothetical protein